jgi:RNA polymerase sigma factor (TIGR02999 family)
LSHDTNTEPAPEPLDLERLSSGDLLPVVYSELRRLAAARLAHEPRAEPMQPTSLVHAAYLRLVGPAAQAEMAWKSRGHFFGAAALAMRRILVERARQRNQVKRGRGWRRVEERDQIDPIEADPIDKEALDLALTELEANDTDMYRVVMLRYFAGLSVDHTAEALGISAVTVKRRWTVARLWLLSRIAGSGSAQEIPTE